MHYNDLANLTAALPVGRHTIYELPEGRVIIRNSGRRHPFLSPSPDFRLHLLFDTRELTPRHSDFFTDYLLKVQIRPELRLPLAEACEQVCNGSSPQGLLTTKRLPRWFAEAGETTWSMQKQQDETGGLPTELFLCGLQVLIRVYELNAAVEKPREAFRLAFLGLEQGKSIVEITQPLQPQVKPGKHYFNRLYRSA